MSKENKKEPKDYTIGELRKLEKAAKSGDQKAQDELNSLDWFSGVSELLKDGEGDSKEYALGITGAAKGISMSIHDALFPKLTGDQMASTHIVDAALSMPPMEQQQNEEIIRELRKINEREEHRERELPRRESTNEDVESLANAGQENGLHTPNGFIPFPPEDSDVYAWLEFRLMVKAAGRKLTLDDLDGFSPFSRSHLGKENPKYLEKRKSSN